MLPTLCDSSDANPHEKSLMPKHETHRSLSRPSSQDRDKKWKYLHWRADRARSASVGGETLIPDTEPERVEELWRHIRNDKVHNMSSGRSILPVRRGGSRIARVQDKHKEEKSRDGTPSEVESTNTRDLSTVITTASSAIARAKKASPYDKDFRAQVSTWWRTVCHMWHF